MWTRARIRASVQTSPLSLTLAQASRNRKSAIVVSKNFPMERHRAIAKMCLAGSFLAIKQKSKRRSGEAARKFKSVSRCFHTIYTAKFMDPESSLNLTYWEFNYTGKKNFLPFFLYDKQYQPVVSLQTNSSQALFVRFFVVYICTWCP